MTAATYAERQKGDDPRRSVSWPIFPSDALRPHLQRSDLMKLCIDTGISWRTLLRLRDGQRYVSTIVADRLTIAFGLTLDDLGTPIYGPYELWRRER